MTKLEFQEYVVNNNIPIGKMRFFVDENRTDPKCFGIYQDGDEWVVYKNKSNGAHVEHFRGSEDAAFQIFYDKMQSEIELRKAKQRASLTNDHDEVFHPQDDDRDQMRKEYVRKINGKRSVIDAVATILIIIIIAISLFLAFSPTINRKYNHQNGYYVINNSVYYLSYGDWYVFDGCGWNPYYDYDDGYYDYYYGDDYSFPDTDYRWENSLYYDQYIGYNSHSTYDNDNWDNDTDFDFDDWDTNDTDWDTDW